MMDLASVRLFTAMPADVVREVLSAATRRKFGNSDTILRADEPAMHLVLVGSGCVNFYTVTEDGHKVLLRRLVPGNAFGIASFLAEPMGYLATATAIHDVEVLTWEHKTVRRLANAYPRFLENGFRIALRYIAEYAQRHMRLVSEPAEDRLAYVLSRLASRAGHILPSGVEVEIKNEDLASLADVSFFTASRVLNRWEEAGAVEKSRGKVLIVSPEKLLVEAARQQHAAKDKQLPIARSRN